MIGYAVNFLIIGILLFLIFNYRGKWIVSQENTKAAAASIKQLENKNGTLTASVQAHEKTREQMEAENSDLKEQTSRFSKVSNVTRIRAVAKIDTAEAIFEMPIVAEFTNLDSTKTVTFSRSGTIYKDWFCSNYSIDNNGLKLIDIEGDISVTTITGFKRKWFLGRQTATTDVTPTSKNVMVTQVVSTNIIVPVRFYETKLFLIGTGFLLKSISENIKF